MLGGTGDLGSALARRWAAAGYPIVLGIAREGEGRGGRQGDAVGGSAAAMTGEDNFGAAKAADVVVLAVPYSNHEAILNEIKSAVGGQDRDRRRGSAGSAQGVGRRSCPPEGSAAQIAQRLLGAEARVVSAFHNVGASKLHAGGSVDCDVLVFGDDKAARDLVIELANAAGTRGIDGGALANSVAAEALTSVLIGINRRYKVDGAGIRITGIPAAGPR